MTSFHFARGALLAMFGCLAPSIAFAQANLTYVSESGTDTGVCDRDAPCRLFNYAITRTQANGILRCLDSGFFGGGTITRSITIDCSGVDAVAYVGPPFAAFLIDDSATAAPGTANVMLRGLNITGLGNTRAGIHFVSGYSLTVENVRIADNSGNPGPNGSNGILFEPTLAARLNVSNSLIVNNGAPVGVAGIYIRPTGAGYAAVTLNNVELTGNTVAGLFVDVGASSGSSTNVVATRSVFSANNTGVLARGNPGTPGVGVTLIDATISGNFASGLNAQGPLAQIRVANSTISGNSTGLLLTNGGVIASYGDNRLIGNGVNGSFNGFPAEE